MDKTWHTEHFFCVQCGQQFGDDGFHEKDGKPYCRKDYFDMFAPKCAGCNRAIMENYISALNSQFHPDCFVCKVSRIYAICAFFSITNTILYLPLSEIFIYTKKQLISLKRIVIKQSLENHSMQWRENLSVLHVLESMKTTERVTRKR